jgi:hypothetical protein
MNPRDLLLIAIQYDRRGKINDAIRFYWMVVNTILVKEDADDGERKLAEYSLKRIKALSLEKNLKK